MNKSFVVFVVTKSNGFEVSRYESPVDPTNLDSNKMPSLVFHDAIEAHCKDFGCSPVDTVVYVGQLA